MVVKQELPPPNCAPTDRCDASIADNIVSIPFLVFRHHRWFVIFSICAKGFRSREIFTSRNLLLRKSRKCVVFSSFLQIPKKLDCSSLVDYNKQFHTYLK